MIIKKTHTKKQNIVCTSPDRDTLSHMYSETISFVRKTFGYFFEYHVVKIVKICNCKIVSNIFRTKLTKKRSVQNPEYNFQPEPQMDVEETYHEIDDNMVRLQLSDVAKSFMS